MLYMFEYFIHSAGRSYFPLRPVLDFSPDEISAFPAGWRVSPFEGRTDRLRDAAREQCYSSSKYELLRRGRQSLRSKIIITDIISEKVIRAHRDTTGLSL
jgi:hypothetical protein